LKQSFIAGAAESQQKIDLVSGSLPPEKHHVGINVKSADMPNH